MDSTNEYEQLMALGELSHHGIKGMKWGIRRQNPSGALFTPVTDPASGAKFTIQHPDTVKIKKKADGTLEVEGPKKERQKVIDEINRQRGVRPQPKTKAEAKEQSPTSDFDDSIRNKAVKDLSNDELQQLVKRMENESKVKNNRKSDLDSNLIDNAFRSKSLSEMNTRDLEFYVRRMELEKKYGEINKKQKSSGKKYLEKFVESEMGKVTKGDWESTVTWKVGAIVASAALAKQGIDTARVRKEASKNAQSKTKDETPKQETPKKPKQTNTPRTEPMHEYDLRRRRQTVNNTNYHVITTMKELGR